MAFYASGNLIVLPGATGSIAYEHTINFFRISLDAISGIAIPAYNWTVIGGPIAQQYRPKTKNFTCGVCMAAEAMLLCRVNDSSGNIEVFASKQLSTDYSLFGSAQWMY